MQDVTVGAVYFRVSYADVDMRLPCVESLVYVGMNLSDEDVEDSWYFQPARNHVRYGRAGTTDTGEQVASIVHRDELGQILDAEAMFEAVRTALAR